MCVRKDKYAHLRAPICVPLGPQAARVGCRPKLRPIHAHLSVLRTASTSGMLALREMALSSFSSWLLSSRYLFLKQMGCKGLRTGTGTARSALGWSPALFLWKGRI